MAGCLPPFGPHPSGPGGHASGSRFLPLALIFSSDLVPPAILPFTVPARLFSPPTLSASFLGFGGGAGSALPTQLVDADALLGSYSFGRVESK